MNGILFRLGVTWRILWVAGILPAALSVVVAVLRWLVPGGQLIAWAWVGLLIGCGFTAEFNRNLFRGLAAALAAMELLAFGCGIAGGGEPSYRACYESALATRMPLVVYVGCAPLGVPGTIEHRAPTFEGVERGIVVAVPRDGWIEWAATLPANADPKRIKEVWAPAPKWSPYAPTLQIRDALSASC